MEFVCTIYKYYINQQDCIKQLRLEGVEKYKTENKIKAAHSFFGTKRIHSVYLISKEILHYNLKYKYW